MKVLIQEPVKEAVKEALAEQRLLAEDVDIQEPDTEPAGGGGGLLGPKTVLPLLGLIGIAIALRRVDEEQLDTSRLENVIEREEETPSMEEDMSKSAAGEGSSTQAVGPADEGQEDMEE